MNSFLFKKGTAGWERAFVLPASPVGHAIFAVLLALVFVNLRITALRAGFAGIPVDAICGGVSLLVTALLLNLAPAKYIKGASLPGKGDE